MRNYKNNPNCELILYFSENLTFMGEQRIQKELI